MNKHTIDAGFVGEAAKHHTESLKKNYAEYLSGDKPYLTYTQWLESMSFNDHFVYSINTDLLEQQIKHLENSTSGESMYNINLAARMFGDIESPCSATTFQEKILDVFFAGVRGWQYMIQEWGDELRVTALAHPIHYLLHEDSAPGEVDGWVKVQPHYYYLVVGSLVQEYTGD